MIRLWSRFVGGRNILELNSRINSLKYKSILDYVGENQLFLDQNLKLAESFKERTIALKMTSLGLPDQNLAYHNTKKIIEIALQNQNRVLIDAESLKDQKAINQISDQLIRDYNTSEKVHVYKTYQMYYQDSLRYLERDLKRFSNLGIKLVRGAYYHQDYRSDLLCHQKSDTDFNYNKGIKLLKGHSNVLLATHNLSSCLLGIQTNPKFEYAQLLGMSDNLSKALYQNGLKVYKYVPFGSFWVSSGYMLRRFYENLDQLKNL